MTEPSLQQSLREYADAIDMDRGHGRSRVTDVMREAADELDRTGSVQWGDLSSSARLADALRAMGNAYLRELIEQGHDPADAEEEVRETVPPGVWASVRDEPSAVQAGGER